jgi:hypothetical protein
VAQVQGARSEQAAAFDPSMGAGRIGSLAAPMKNDGR